MATGRPLMSRSAQQLRVAHEEAFTVAGTSVAFASGAIAIRIAPPTRARADRDLLLAAREVVVRNRGRIAPPQSFVPVHIALTTQQPVRRVEIGAGVAGVGSGGHGKTLAQSM